MERNTSLASATANSSPRRPLLLASSTNTMAPCTCHVSPLTAVRLARLCRRRCNYVGTQTGCETAVWGHKRTCMTSGGMRRVRVPSCSAPNAAPTSSESPCKCCIIQQGSPASTPKHGWNFAYCMLQTLGRHCDVQRCQRLVGCLAVARAERSRHNSWRRHVCRRTGKVLVRLAPPVAYDGGCLAQQANRGRKGGRTNM